MLLNKTRTVFSRAAQDGDIGALVALLPQVLDLGESDIILLALLYAIFQYISAVCEHAAILRQQLPHLCTSLTQLVSAHFHAAIASLVTEYSVPSADECWSFQLQLSGKEPKKKRKPNRGNKMNKTKKFHGNLPSA